MKVNYKKAIDINIELKLNVDQQQDKIKHLTEQCDIDDEDNYQEITAAIIPMKKRKRTVYVTCNRTFATQNGLKKNISRKSTISSGELIMV